MSVNDTHEPLNSPTGRNRTIDSALSALGPPDLVRVAGELLSVCPATHPT